MRWAIAAAFVLLLAAPAAAAETPPAPDDITAAVSVRHAPRHAAAVSGVEILVIEGDELIVRGSADEVERLAAFDHVTSAQQVWAPVETALSQGVALVGGDTWGQSGHARSVIKVAIVDTGFFGFDSLLGIELPAAVATHSARFDGIVATGSGHGTAVAEIVHDVAPGAQLHLVAVDSDIRFPDVVDYLIANDIDVVAMSIGWTRGPYDGTALVSTEVSRAVAAGITWVNAAGNEAATHWSGPFIDADGDGIGEFSGSDEINRFRVPPHQSFTVDIGWTGTADLDLCLYSYEGETETFETCSILSQGLGDPPAESIQWYNGSSNTADFGYSVRYYSGSPIRLDAFLGGRAHTLEHSASATSLVVPAEVSDAIAVGAAEWFAPEGVTYYSSRGPTVNGVTKPDFAAPTSVTTATFGVFSGTSAAAPHVAGVAALLLEAEPSLSPHQLKTALAAVAVPMGSEGKSNEYGWGRGHAGPTPGIVTLISTGHLEHDSIAIVDSTSGVWDMRFADGSRRMFYFGNPGDIPIAGDWDCDGVDSPGLFRSSDAYVYLRNSNTQGPAHHSYFFGNPGDLPIAGDFDGDGCDSVALYRPSTQEVFVLNTVGDGGSGAGAADISFMFGDVGDVVVAADFDSDDDDDFGVHRGGTILYRSTLGSGVADGQFDFGEAGDVFLSGDWMGTGLGPAVYRSSVGTFFYRTGFEAGPAEGTISVPDGTVVAGFWGS